MREMVQDDFDSNEWHLGGLANIRQFGARWEGLGPPGRRLAQARIHMEIMPRPAQGDSLVTVDALLTDPAYQPTFPTLMHRATGRVRSSESAHSVS
jgi:hypothetical protein